MFVRDATDPEPSYENAGHKFVGMVLHVRALTAWLKAVFGDLGVVWCDTPHPLGNFPSKDDD